MNKQAGFTLIELVVVIVILGLLAAAALPKFINVTSDARFSSLQGVAGGLRTAASLARAEYVVSNNNAAVTVVMDGQNITVLSENANAGRGGRPTAAAGGIGGANGAMPDPDGFTVTHGAPAAGQTTYQPAGGSATCQVVYTAAALGDPVSVTANSAADC